MRVDGVELDECPRQPVLERLGDALAADRHFDGSSRLSANAPDRVVQSQIAGILAVYFRCNLPVALLVSMLSNPVTMGPLYYGAYRLGLVLLGRPPVGDSPELELEGIWSQVDDIMVPLLLGCAVMATLFALAARWLLNWLWVSSTRRQMHQRAMARRR